MTIATEAATRHIADIVAAARPDDIPAAVTQHSLRTFVNFVGCAAGGARNDVVERVEQAMLPQAGIGKSGVIGRPTQTTAITAALLNGIAGAVNAFDDTHAEALIHPGPPIGAALVAVSGGMDKAVSGLNFLLAHSWGLEVACRLSKAVSVAPAISDVGWSQTGISAPSGAAAASAKLLGLDAQHTAWAIGIAASLSSGLRVAHGSVAMHLAPAQAAATGVQAALLAQAGITGPENAFEGRYGFLDLFARPSCISHLTEGLGTRFELLGNTFKAYPCGIVIHGVIDACLALRPDTGLKAEDIAEIVLEVPLSLVALTDKPHPTGIFAAQVSAQHWAAASLLFGKAGIEQGLPAVIENSDIRSVRDRCRIVPRPDMPVDAASVSVRLSDGRVLSRHVDHYTGSLSKPLDDEALSRKFLDQASGVIGKAEADHLMRQCWNLPNSTDVGSIWRTTS